MSASNRTNAQNAGRPLGINRFCAQISHHKAIKLQIDKIPNNYSLH